MTEISPGTVQASLSVLSRASRLPILTTEVEPGAHGPAGASAQGVGVPEAADVRTEPLPNGGILAGALGGLTESRQRPAADGAIRAATVRERSIRAWPGARDGAKNRTCARCARARCLSAHLCYPDVGW